MNAIVNWRELKDQGKVHFESHRLIEAVVCWSRAYELLSTLQRHEETAQGGAATPLLFYQQERQYLLSNIIACKLNLLEEDIDNTSIAQAESIVGLAKECVQLNDLWAKAHVRLASAYIALDSILQKNSTGTGRMHSNDACLSLQTALRLDPSNRLARNMLVKELSRRDRGTCTNSSDDRTNNENLSYFNQAKQHLHMDIPDIDVTPNDPTLLQRFHLAIQTWFRQHPFFSSHDARDLYIVIFVLFLLYISFDGRFGWNQLKATTSASSRRQTLSGKNYVQDRPRSRQKSHIQNQRHPPLDSSTQSTWIPLTLFFVTMIPFLQPNILRILPVMGMRFFHRGGIFGGNRWLDLVPLIWIITMFVILFLGFPIFQIGGYPVVIHGFMGPIGFFIL